MATIESIHVSLTSLFALKLRIWR